MDYFIESDLEEQDIYSKLRLAKLQLQNYNPQNKSAQHFIAIIHKIISSAYQEPGWGWDGGGMLKQRQCHSLAFDSSS